MGSCTKQTTDCGFAYSTRSNSTPSTLSPSILPRMITHPNIEPTTPSTLSPSIIPRISKHSLPRCQRFLPVSRIAQGLHQRHVAPQRRLPATPHAALKILEGF